MIIGIGIDIVEVRRMEAAAGRKSFLEKVFTVREREYCQSRGQNIFASYAAKFAAKEAVAKAFGTGFYPNEAKDIEIVNVSTGRPDVMLSGVFLKRAKEMGITRIHISLTHTREYAAANVILWGEEGGK